MEKDEKDTIDTLIDRIMRLSWDDRAMVFHLVERLESSSSVPLCSLRFVTHTVGYKEKLKRPVCPVDPHLLGNASLFSSSQSDQVCSDKDSL